MYNPSWPEYLKVEKREPKRLLRSNKAPLLVVPLIKGTFQDSISSLFNELPAKTRSCSDDRDDMAMDEGHATMSSSVECDLSNKSDHQCTENTANYLTVTEKGKFKWNSLFEDLKTFMDELTGNDA